MVINSSFEKENRKSAYGAGTEQKYWKCDALVFKLER